jgi:diguanylate cyclase (GGDEF)-like protein
MQRRADEIEQHARELQEASVTDELTGLLNRRGFMLLAEQEMKAATRNARQLTLFFVDLDGMKTINDTLGHKMGDRALVDTAAVLRGVFRGSDVVARLGGDEFVVLAPETASESEAQCSERLRQALETYNETSTSFRLSLSMGASMFDPSAPITLQKLLADADGHMYEQKRRARSTDLERIRRA